MTKTTSKRSSKSRTSPVKTTQRKSAKSAVRDAASPRLTAATVAPSTPLSTAGKPRADTKQARVIAMLRAPAGATIDEMMRATGWRQHSVRGFLAGVVRKKLGLDLISKPSESGRVYRINDRTASSATNTKTNKAA
jgi:hypothetical protein